MKPGELVLDPREALKACSQQRAVDLDVEAPEGALDVEGCGIDGAWETDGTCMVYLLSLRFMV